MLFTKAKLMSIEILSVLVKPYIMKKPYILLITLCLIISCKTEKKSQQFEDKSIGIDTVSTPSSIEKNSDLTEIEEDEEEDIEDDMKFMPPIENDSYLGVVVGNNMNDHQNILKPGTLQTGEGVFDVHYIIYKADTLGYAYGNDIIESLHIWDPRGATNNGIRVGTTFGELKDILKEPKVHGSEIEARVHVFNEKHMYRLNYNSMEYNLDYLKIPDTVMVQEIIITK